MILLTTLVRVASLFDGRRWLHAAERHHYATFRGHQASYQSG